MRYGYSVGASLIASSPAFAASGPFFSLNNTDFVVTLAFLAFVAVLLYLKVPGMLSSMLDKRAQTVRAELGEARSLREEAQSLLADYERKQKEVETQSQQIVKNAKAEAQRASLQARDDLEKSVARRMQGAQDQIASAQAAAIKDVRDTAVMVAVAAAQDVIAKQISTKTEGDLIEDAIAEISAKLH